MTGTPNISDTRRGHLLRGWLETAGAALGRGTALLRGGGGGSAGAETSRPRPRHLSLALQGGGVEFDGISGTSAGAVNAVVMASGLAQGGRDGARAALERFWRRISKAGALTPFGDAGSAVVALVPASAARPLASAAAVAIDL